MRRLTRDSTGVVTLNLRSSRILVFWATFDRLVPVQAGWYFHAASVAGRASTVDGERRLDAAFDLTDKQVLWQHAKIDQVGGADLFLDTNRRYVFYVTADAASPNVLRQEHLPWPFELRSPKAAGEPAVIVFQAWPLQLDYHEPELREVTSKSSANQSSLMSFLDSFGNTSRSPRRAHRTAARCMTWWICGRFAD